MAQLFDHRARGRVVRPVQQRQPNEAYSRRVLHDTCAPQEIHRRHNGTRLLSHSLLGAPSPDTRLARTPRPAGCLVTHMGLHFFTGKSRRPPQGAWRVWGGAGGEGARRAAAALRSGSPPPRSDRIAGSTPRTPPGAPAHRRACHTSICRHLLGTHTHRACPAPGAQDSTPYCPSG